MSVEYIYQYTNLNTLSLILKNSTIRFTRMDAVNDPEEKNHLDENRCSYISSWTRSREEDIAMWSMYGDNFEGVRIGMPKLLFKESLEDSIFQKIYGNIKRIKMICMKNFSFDLIPQIEYLNDEHSLSKIRSIYQKVIIENPGILNIFSVFHHKNIIYKKTKPSENKHNQNKSNHDKKKIEDYFHKEVFEKNPSWRYENEYRFAIDLLVNIHLLDPIIERIDIKNKDILEIYSTIIPFLITPKYIDVQYYLQNHKIDICYGAKMKEGDKYLLKLLLNKYYYIIEVKDFKDIKSKIAIC